MSKQKEDNSPTIKINKNAVENYMSRRCVKRAIPLYCFIINDLIEVDN